MSDNTLKRERKRRRVADDKGSARNATSITTHDESNERHHVPEAPYSDDLKVILSTDGQINDSHIVETLGSICKSLGSAVYMADPAELGSMLGSEYTLNTAITKSIEHENCSTILLPILSNRSQSNGAKHWVLVVVSHEPSRLYCAKYKEDRVNDAIDGTNAFIKHYLEDSPFNPEDSLHQCACCVRAAKADSGVCIFAFSMYVIARCPMPHHLPMDTWRLIMAYLLGFKDDRGVERHMLLSERNLNDTPSDTAPGIINKTKLQERREHLDDFIVEFAEIVMVLTKVLARMTGSSSGGQSGNNTTDAAANENGVGQASIGRERLSLASTDLSTLYDEKKKERDQLADIISNFEKGMAAATG